MPAPRRDPVSRCACRDKTRDWYDRQGQFGNEPRGRFKTAFVEALQLLSWRKDVASGFSTLLPLAEQVEDLRKRRNEMIHELATEAARRERRDLAKPLTKAAHDLDFKLLQEAASNHRRLQKERLGAVIEELCRHGDLRQCADDRQRQAAHPLGYRIT